MSRPFCHRRIAGRPATPIFKPIGIPILELEEVVMTLDEFEAIRLADLDGLYQEQAAAQMNVSRATFSRIIEAAHRKLAEAGSSRRRTGSWRMCWCTARRCASRAAWCGWKASGAAAGTMMGEKSE